MSCPCPFNVTFLGKNIGLIQVHPTYSMPILIQSSILVHIHMYGHMRILSKNSRKNWTVPEGIDCVLPWAQFWACPGPDILALPVSAHSRPLPAANKMLTMMTKMMAVVEMMMMTIIMVMMIMTMMVMMTMMIDDDDDWLIIGGIF